MCVKIKIIFVERSISNGPNAQIRMNPEIVEKVSFYRIFVANTFLLIYYLLCLQCTCFIVHPFSTDKKLILEKFAITISRSFHKEKCSFNIEYSKAELNLLT